MEKRGKLYEGKAKVLYTTDEADLVIQHFKDDATAFNGEKKGEIANKGRMNNLISARIFYFLNESGIKTHYVATLNDNEQLVKKLAVIPIEVVVRNVVAGSLAKRLGKEEGMELDDPVIELYFKDDSLGDPMINRFHVNSFKIADPEHIRVMEVEAQRINNMLWSFFDERGILLVDFKLEFGLHKGELLLGDEISPDSCRLWDKETKEKLDKDRFRRDLGNIEESYQEVLDRVLK
ncbi:MAG: phosphoribosylaminoimidazolesuccinocarboxamide synthase [Proteobacteria bacterium]|nr:phosphoribosylaminoimidazolesuccinocarboxamide synthase [Pseudomonadota bacterium]